MAMLDMADLMTEHARDLVGRPGLPKEAVEQGDLAAGQRHRIGDRDIDHADAHLAAIERKLPAEPVERLLSLGGGAGPATKIADQRIAECLLPAFGDKRGRSRSGS